MRRRPELAPEQRRGPPNSTDPSTSWPGAGNRNVTDHNHAIRRIGNHGDRERATAKISQAKMRRQMTHETRYGWRGYRWSCEFEWRPMPLRRVAYVIPAWQSTSREAILRTTQWGGVPLRTGGAAYRWRPPPPPPPPPPPLQIYRARFGGRGFRLARPDSKGFGGPPHIPDQHLGFPINGVAIVPNAISRQRLEMKINQMLRRIWKLSRRRNSSEQHF